MVEAPALLAAEPWFATEVEGLQLYDYGTVDELTGERVLPQPGDRLHLVREPANPHDKNAIQVWWRNSRMIGHLPRFTAGRVAPLLDAGAAARAYVHTPGDGEAWSLRTLVVGPAAEPIHGRYIQDLADAAMCRSDAECERDRLLYDRAERNRLTLRQHRRRRLRDAVEVLRQVPCEPVLPAPSSSGRTDVDDIADVLRCSRSTVVRIAASVGISLGRWDYSVEVTTELRAALLEWDRKPKRGKGLPALKGKLEFPGVLRRAGHGGRLCPLPVSSGAPRRRRRTSSCTGQPDASSAATPPSPMPANPGVGEPSRRIKLDIGSWGHTHMILPAGAAETAARRRAAEASKKERHA